MTYVHGRYYGPKKQGYVVRNMDDPIERIYGPESSWLPSTERSVRHAFGDDYNKKQDRDEDNRPLLIGD